MAPADAESLVRLALATRLGSISTSRGEWHLFSWVGWQVSRWLRPWAKSADRLFGGAPRVSPRPSPEAIHIFPCRLRGVGTSRVSLPRPRPGYVRTLRGIFSRAASCACESCRGQRAKPLSLVSCHSSSRRLLFFLQPSFRSSEGCAYFNFNSLQLSSSLAPAIVWNTASALRSIEMLLK